MDISIRIIELVFNNYCVSAVTYISYVLKYNRIVLWSLFTRYIVFKCKLRQYWAKTATIFLLHLFIPPPAQKWFSGGSTKMRQTTYIIISFCFYLFRLYRNGKYKIHLIDMPTVYVCLYIIYNIYIEQRKNSSLNV